MDSETQSAAVSAKKKGKKKNKKIQRKVVTVLVVVLLVGGVIFACMPKGAAGMGTAVYKNDVFTVTRGEVYDTISATGLIESSEDTTAKVHSTLTYKIGTVNVALGDKVSEGDVLCVYDTETLERQIRERELSMTTSERSAALNLANAKLNYESCLAGVNAGTNASLVSAESSYASAAEALERAQEDYDKYAKKLSASAVITLNQAKRNLDDAQADYDKYAKKLADSAVVTLNQAKRNLDDAQKNYDDLKTDIENKTHTQIRSAQRTLDTAKKNYEDYKADYADDRTSALYSADAAVKSARSALDAAKSSLSALKKQWNEETDPVEIAKLEAQIEVQEANVATLEANYRTAQDTYDLAAEEGDRTLETYKQQYDNAVDAYDDVIDSLEKTLDSYETALANAKDNYENAKEGTDDTLKGYEKALANAKDVYQNALDGTDDTLKNYETALTNAKRQARDAKINLQNTKTSVDNQLEGYRIAYENAKNTANTELSDYQLANLYADLGKATVTAPIAGTVTMVNATEGETASGVLFVIEDTDALVVTATVKAYDLDRVREGMRVTVESDTTGDAVYEGVLESVAPTAKKDATGSIVSTNDAEFETIIRVTDKDTGLKIGVSARIAYVAEEAKDALCVPESAVLTEGGESYVLCVTDKAADGSFTLARTPVTVGVSDGVTVAVEGVAEGDEVADNAKQYLSMVGMRLTLSENSALTGSMAAMMAMGGGMRAGN